jgi:hypothetical protein
VNLLLVSVNQGFQSGRYPVHFLIDLKTRAVAPFFPDVRTFHNIYKLQKHVLLRHQSYRDSFYGLQKFTILADNAPLNIEFTLTYSLF